MCIRDRSYIVAVKPTDGNAENPQGIHPNRTANGGGIIGAMISSDKPVVVNSGSMAGSNDHTQQGRRDFGMDQLVGIEKIGTEYIFVRGVGNNKIETKSQGKDRFNRFIGRPFSLILPYLAYAQVTLFISRAI